MDSGRYVKSQPGPEANKEWKDEDDEDLPGCGIIELESLA